KQNEWLGILCGLDQIGRQPDGLSRDLCEVVDAALRISDGSVQSRSDGCTAHIDLVQHSFQSYQSIDLVIQALGERMEFLSQCHVHRILQLGAPYLDHVTKFPAFSPKSRHKNAQL